MANGVFVTGTDTGVGKTVVSAALVTHLRHQGPVRYWKPIQTGIEQDDDTATVASLARCSSQELLSDGVRLPRPLSPHLSARLSHRTIELGPLEDMFNTARKEGGDVRQFVVEGAGGVLVPINDVQMMIDLMARLDLPAVIVSRSTLGTINHTLLTIDALRRRSIAIAGVVMVGPANAENKKAIEQYGNVKVAGEMPVFDPLTPEALAAWAESGLHLS